MHDQDQGPAGDDAFVLDLEVHRHDLGDGRADPTAGPKGVVAAGHDEPAAEVLDVVGEHLLLLAAEGVGRHVGQDHAGIVEQIEQIHPPFRDIEGLDVDVLALEGFDKHGIVGRGGT